MSLPPLNDNVKPPNALDPKYHADGRVFSFKNGALFNMSFQVGVDGPVSTEMLAGIVYCIKGFANRNAVDVLC